MHITTHLKTPISEQLITFIDWFPGVPIFFSVSGFLIAMSFERSSSVAKYFWNRFLRIFPALWVCFFVSVFILFIFGFVVKELSNVNFYLWSAFQLSGFTVGMHVFQKIIFANYGVGEVNGALWTIPLELQFYLLLPLFFLVKNRTLRIFVVVLAFVISVMTYNKIVGNWPIKEFKPRIFKLLLLNFTFFPHFFSFLLGTLFYLNFDRLKKFVEAKFFMWIVIYVLIRISYIWMGYIDYYQIEQNLGLLLIYRVILLFLIMSFAFSFRWVSDKLLRGNDISYGFYIYHMLIVNAFVHLGYTGDYKFTLGAFCISIICGILSWLLVEKKMLKLKHKPFFFSFKESK